jgi:hypothetical protein
VGGRINTGGLQQADWQLEDELLAILGVGQVDRIVRIDQQQLAGGQIVLVVAAAPQAVTLEQYLQVVDGFQRVRGDPRTAAIADPTQIQAGEFAVTEAGRHAALTRQLDAMMPDVLVDITRHGIGIGMVEHHALVTQ